MEFPIAGVIVNPAFLAGIGFLVGILGGFFGVGGGFIAGPMMFLAGVPMNFVVGTDLARFSTDPGADLDGSLRSSSVECLKAGSAALLPWGAVWPTS